MWTVDLGVIEAWLMKLDDDTYDQVIAAIELLQDHGPQLGRPIVDTVKGSAYKNMKEGRQLEELVPGEHSDRRRSVHGASGPAEEDRERRDQEEVITMALTPEQLLEKRPANRARVDTHKERMLGEVRAYRLRELREQLGLSQAQLAERIGVGQRQVSKIENGDLDSARVGTVRKYIEAVGGDLVIEYVAGDSRLQVA